MLIRPGRVKEAAEVSCLMYKAFLPYRRYYTLGAFDYTILDLKKIKERVKKKLLFVVEKEGRIIGTGSYRDDGNFFYIRSMAVDPKYQGQGVARTMLQFFENLAKEKGFKEITLETTPFLKRAITLYQTFGFRRVENSGRDFFGNIVFLMQKQLK
ncbi:MAG: GNAT family N-acetyltransferase [Candidatus Aminicenantia bacterium]